MRLFALVPVTKTSPVAVIRQEVLQEEELQEQKPRELELLVSSSLSLRLSS
jgi:hypothetical protein